VKGKEEAVRIFALLGRSAEEGEFVELAGRHQRFLAAYRSQRWDEARRLATECRSHDARLADLYDMYETRIYGLELAPPGAHWNGVFTAHNK
jgi:hypothetical protein